MSLDKKEAQLESDIESIDESGEINRPFDPNEIKISTQQLTIQHLIERLEFNEINLYTEFQRQHDLWNKEKQSRLIESILLNMPLPSFYFDGERDNNWQVVDGLQRVSTIKNFLQKKAIQYFLLDFNSCQLIELFDHSMNEGLEKELSDLKDRVLFINHHAIKIKTEFVTLIKKKENLLLYQYSKIYPFQIIIPN